MDTQVTVHSITDAIPADAICKRFGVKPRTIRLARENGTFAASWYLGMKALCKEHGLDCPDSLFNFRSPSSGAASSEPATAGDSLPQENVGIAVNHFKTAPPEEQGAA